MPTATAGAAGSPASATGDGGCTGDKRRCCCVLPSPSFPAVVAVEEQLCRQALKCPAAEKPNLCEIQNRTLTCHAAQTIALHRLVRNYPMVHIPPIVEQKS